MVWSSSLADNVEGHQESSDFTVKVRVQNLSGETFSKRLDEVQQAFGLQTGNKVAWITPHDDDPLIGAGSTIKLLSDSGIESHILVTTDGSMGYHDASHRARVVQERIEQTRDAFSMVGVAPANIYFMNFPDAGLAQHAGRIGDGGLQVAYEKILRTIAPAAVFFVGVRRDSIEHPDHLVVNEQGLWAARHASGTDWQDIAPGGNFRQTLRIFEYPVYSELVADPTIQIISQSAENVKIRALAKYEGQSIQDLIDQQKERGGEYFREIPIVPNFNERYRKLFV